MKNTNSIKFALKLASLLTLVLLGFVLIYNYLTHGTFNLTPNAAFIPEPRSCPKDECRVGKCVNGWYYECAGHGYKVSGKTCLYKSLFKTGKKC